MILWSILDPRQYDQLITEGILFGKEEIVFSSEQWPYFEIPYRWMADQMHKRIGPPPEDLGITIPVWAWYQYESAQKKKPDLRNGDYNGFSGYRVELDVPDDMVLLSDFNTWHAILNNHPICINREEESWYEEIVDRYKPKDGLSLEEFFQKCIEHPEEISEYQSKEKFPGYEVWKEKSWELIFDLDFDFSYYTYPRDKKTIQATMWSFMKDWIRRVDPIRRDKNKLFRKRNEE